MCHSRNPNVQMGGIVVILEIPIYRLVTGVKVVASPSQFKD